jgi:hypothetical protein
MSTEPLRKMRDEIEEIIDLCHDASIFELSPWKQTLDAYLAVPRCPGCGTTLEPDTWHTSPPEEGDIIKVFRDHYGYNVECLHPHCDHGFIADTEAEALAAFYGAITRNEEVKK